MTDFAIPASYVLTDFDPGGIGKMLEGIRSNLKGVELNFQAADLPTLRTSLLALTAQVQELGDAVRAGEAADAPDMASTTLFMPAAPDRHLPVLYTADLATRVVNHGSVDGFLRAAEAVVREKRTSDPQVKKALDDLFRTCNPKDAPERQLVEYYALFFPGQDALAAAPVGVLRQLFEAIVAALKRLIKSFRAGAAATWEVLKDPDAVYLRLRGEMHELQTRHPGFRWLEYVVLVPDLFRLYVRLMFDPDVAWTVKAKVLGAVLYLVTPFDFIPEGLVGPLGYTEDVFLMAKAILDMTNANQVSPGKLLEHWAGSREVLGQVMWVSRQFEEHFDLFKGIHGWYRGAGLVGTPR